MSKYPPPIETNCACCGMSFMAYRYRTSLKWPKYCSFACKGASKTIPASNKEQAQ